MAGQNWTCCSDKRLDPCSCNNGPVDPENGLHRAEIVCTTTTVDTRITSFDLGPNNLVGSIPASIGGLTKLNEFGIFTNPGKGTARLSGHPWLRSGRTTRARDSSTVRGVGGAENGSNHRDDENVGLAGSVIPSTIGKLANPGLRRAHLYQNGFGGTIPPSIGELTSLQKLMLDGAALVVARVPFPSPLCLA